MISSIKKLHPHGLRRSLSTAVPPHLHQPDHYLLNSKLANDHLSWLCNRGLHREALGAFQALQSRAPHLLLTPATYRHLLLSCSHLHSSIACRNVHRHLARAALRPDLVLCNHILNAYGKCGSIEDACKLFDEMPERNAVSWTAIIAMLARSHREAEAVEAYLEMLNSGISPDRFAIASIMGACAGIGDGELGRQLHCHAIKWKYASDQLVENALLSLYGKCGWTDDAGTVFTRIREKSIISWGAMISGLAQQGQELEALVCFRQMLRLGLYTPNGFIFGSVFRACVGLPELAYGEQMHSLCVKFGVEDDNFTGCSLSKMYSEFGCVDSALKAFEEIGFPDLVSWNSIIKTLAYANQLEDAMALLSNMRSSGLEPDDLTFKHLLCGVADPAWLHDGKAIHAYIVKMGFCADVSACNTLLTMYTKCSDYPTACRLFMEMEGKRDLVTWNVILAACLRHSKFDEAVNMFKVLIKTCCKLDNITLNSILGSSAELACLQTTKLVHAHSCKVGLESDVMVANGLIDSYAKSGSLDDAERMFQLMGDMRDLVSWSSLIVGYAQFGCAREAIELFQDMLRLGIKPNHVTYLGVLSACCHVGMVDMGCYYFEKMQVEHGIVPTREHYSSLVDMLVRAGCITETLMLLERMPFEPDVIVWKAVLNAFWSHGNMGIAMRAVEGIMKLDPSNSMVYAFLCNAYAASGYWQGVARMRRMMGEACSKKDPGKSWIKIEGVSHDFLAGDTLHPRTEDIYALLEDLRLKMGDAGDDPSVFLEGKML